MFVILFLYFLRMIVHYMMQYFVLRMMTVPVTRFRPMWHRIDLVYAPWYLYQDVFVVFIGIMANTILFGILDRSTYIAKKYCKCMPK